MDERLLAFGRRAAVATLPARLNAALSEAAQALASAGVRCLLLKGPAVAVWLYDGETRWYRDIDLLVSKPQLGAAEGVLGGLGFVRSEEPDALLLVDRHHYVWERADGVVLELHWTLVGTGASAAAVWRVLGEQSERIRICGVEVEVPSLPARTMHLALHAAQHGGVGQPREDLERGIARLAYESWEQARDLAVRLDAMSAFAAGVRCSPAGDALASRLELPAASVYWSLRASGAPPTAGRLWYLRHAKTWRDRWRLVVWFWPQASADGASATGSAIVAELARSATAVTARYLRQTGRRWRRRRGARRRS